jgi:flagellar protein FlaG
MDAMEVAAAGQIRTIDTSLITTNDKPVRPVVKHEPEPKAEPVLTAEDMQKDLRLLKEALDRVVKNTRFTYHVNEKIDQFVVRIVDKDTDNVIKEIPSREIQRMHENIQEAVGLIFDTLI